MLINEDFFDKLEVNDKDIFSSENAADNLFDESEFSSIKSRFSNTIIINHTTDIKHNKDFGFDIDEYVKCMKIQSKRILQILDLFEIEHSDFFVTDSSVDYLFADKPMYMKKHEDYTELYRDVDKATWNDMYGANYPCKYYYLIYVNFPKLSPKRIIKFVQILLKVSENDYYLNGSTTFNINIFQGVYHPEDQRSPFLSDVKFIILRDSNLYDFILSFPQIISRELSQVLCYFMSYGEAQQCLKDLRREFG